MEWVCLKETKRSLDSYILNNRLYFCSYWRRIWIYCIWNNYLIYVILITKSVYIAKTAKDDLGSYIAMGIAGIFFFHMIENIGMTMGILPITGIPLPFVSYGGSSLVTNFICIALLLNISARRQKAIFME